MWYWLGLAALLLIAEVNTGTIYLMIVAAGFALSALFAGLGFSLNVQLAICSVGILIALFVFIRLKKSCNRLGSKSSQAFDHGQVISVPQWDNSNTARVDYRGTQWNARLLGTSNPEHLYYIEAIEGTVLLLQSIHNRKEV